MTQKRAIATGLAILLGAVAGAVVAMNERPVSSPRPDAATARAEPRAATASASPATIEPSTPDAASPQAPAVAAPATPSAAAELALPTPAFDLTPPTTKEQLLAVQMSCTRKIPEDCERAARALDAGTVQRRDAERARMLNRIALTVYVKQCESDRALACARLAEMHEIGEIVQRNPGTARSLRRRFHELCAKKRAQPGCTPAQPSSARNPG